MSDDTELERLPDYVQRIERATDTFHPWSVWAEPDGRFTAEAADAMAADLRSLLSERKALVEEVERRETLFDAIRHGDEAHQDWLREAIEDHFAGRPVNRPVLSEKPDPLPRMTKALEEIRDFEPGAMPAYDVSVRMAEIARAALGEPE